ncbi:MAG TPA: hypothetical protein VJT73_14965 [Polyangiaceae bacterium]|nr:hypothetical protein [Polyangiaceae bacterium]
MTRPRRPALGLKTYSHLSRERRLPSDYELVTSELLYYPKRGFEVQTPLQGWYDEHQRRSPLTVPDWERFRDPRETTYATYTALASERETYVDGTLSSIEETDYDKELSTEWRTLIERVVAPLRFPVHGLQMVSAYVGQMAPSGRITVAAAFQTADEVRRIQRVAYRMAQLSMTDPMFGKESRDSWQKDEIWQPLREAVERCLVAYDWGEAFVALNVCIKPVIDELFMVHLPKVAKDHGDYLLGQIFSSLNEDCKWHRDWAAALLTTAVRDRPGNRDVIAGWVDRWRPIALAAAAPFGFLFPEAARVEERLADVTTDLLRRADLGWAAK